MAGSEGEPTAGRQRLLEGWLPLAQEANGQYGWALDAAALEALILAAAPALQQAHTAFEARLSLWCAYQRRRRNEPHEQQGEDMFTG